MKLTFFLYNFGCKVNQAEGEEIAGHLAKKGWSRVWQPGEANLLLVNTCAVTAEAERKARKLIRKLKRENPSAVLVFTGCFAELKKIAGEILFPVDLFVPQSEKEKTVEKITDFFAKMSGQDNFNGKLYRAVAGSRENLFRSRAFIKVQDGCSHCCSYCIVPLLRGKEKSTPLKEVVNKVKEASLSFKEVVLCGVRLGCYGIDFSPPSSLVKLLKTVLKATSLVRIRLSSIEPSDLTHELVDLMAREKRIASHLHLPLQSGDDRILKKMNRPYTAQEFLEKVKLVRQAVPDIAITTDVMIGFPGETDEAFENTIKVIREAAFSRLHVFKFSPRPGTEAFSFSGRPSGRVVLERARRLQFLDRELRSRYARSFLGKTLEVVVEKTSNGWKESLSSNYLRVYFPPSGFSGSNLVQVLIEEEKEGVLFGKILIKKEV